MAFLCPNHPSGTCVEITDQRRATLFEHHGGVTYTMNENTIAQLKAIIQGAYPNINAEDILDNNTPDHGMDVHIYDENDPDDTTKMISFKDDATYALIHNELVQGRQNLLSQLRDYITGAAQAGGRRRKTHRRRGRKTRSRRRCRQMRR